MPDLGATSAARTWKSRTYVEKALGSELSGNVIDICPVGALTSKPYAFIARPWELKKTDSVDVLDAVGTTIRIDSRGPEVLRILPRINEEVNEEWIGRQVALRDRRAEAAAAGPALGAARRQARRATWPEAFAAIAERLRGLPGERIGAIAGDLCDAESMVALKDLMPALGSPNLDCRQDGAKLDAARRDFYCFNSGIAGIERGRRAADRRQQPALRGAGAQRAHPQALAARRTCRSA